jgi:hypothetical protein
VYRSSGHRGSGGRSSGGTGRRTGTNHRPPQVPRRTGPWRQLCRALGVDSNALCRPIDQARSLLACAVGVLIAGAVAGAWLTALLALHGVLATTAQQRPHRHLVPAVTVSSSNTDAGADNGNTISQAQATWTYPTGHPHTAPIDVPENTRAGARVTTWVDDSGSATTGPGSNASAVSDAVLAGILVLAGEAGAVALVSHAARHAIDRWADRAWDDDWARVEPGWSGRSGRRPRGTG